LLKSINQYFNKEKSRLQSFIGDQGTSRRITRLTNKRNKKVSDYLHKASRYIINLCCRKDIGKIIIGKNKQWKSGIEIGRVNNQNFVSIPHAQFIQMIEYKAKLFGIEVILAEESYTSKCSFIDNEKICKHENYLGKRIKRGLFRTFNNIVINADVNASFNIARKVIPRFNVKELNEEIEGFVVNPVRINPYKLKTS
jgi:putative transposase